MLFLHYSKCSTCAKAKTWLSGTGQPYEVRDIKAQPPTRAELIQWHQKSGLPLRRFFNTSGLVYKSLGLAQKLPGLSEEEQLALLSSDGMLVKRPILVDGERVLVGFQEAAWEAHFTGKQG